MRVVLEKPSTLMEALESLYPDSSRSTLRSWIKIGRVLVDGAVVTREKEQLEKGQTVSVEKKKESIEGGGEVLFEDAHILVIDKPAGLLTVATDFKKVHTLHTYLKERPHTPRIWPVHRLDRDTSGLLVFAKTEKARDSLKEQFAAHTVSRTYHALIEGVLEGESGTWESLLHDGKDFVVKSVKKGGKRAVTHYRKVRSQGTYTLLELNLETGRKNQIRVHAADAGHPIVGDKKYGSTTNPYKRLCLHASTLEFTHPITGKRMSFNSPTPPAFILS